MNRRSARRAAAIWAVLLLTLTSWPSPPPIPVVSAIPDFDKLGHALLYGCEGFFLYFAIAWPVTTGSGWRRALAVAGVLAVFGTLDEIHQAFIPGRAMEGLDAFVDGVGGFLGAATADAVASRKGRAPTTS